MAHPAKGTRNDPPRIFSEADCAAIVERAKRFKRGDGDIAVGIGSWWQGEVRWARNRVNLASDRRNITLSVMRGFSRGDSGAVQTNQVDDASLEAAVRAAERLASRRPREGYRIGEYPPMPEYARTPGTIWSESTYGLTTDQRSKAVQALVAAAEDAGMLAAGYLEVRAGSIAVLGFDHLLMHYPYTRFTQAQCSLTVRDAKGRGSGWAGLSSFDWDRIDAPQLAQRAIEKCRASRDPVALEPGRYTVILEPQAVADLMALMVSDFHRAGPEYGGNNPFTLSYDQALGVWRSKLGLKVMDSRITISHDPRDPLLGLVSPPREDPGQVTFVDKGVLTALGHTADQDISALKGRHERRALTGYRMTGGSASMEEMIASTKRGLIVTRFSNLRKLDVRSVLATGLTRDGLWLVENGKITKAVKNFRFTESVLFALNNVEQLGEPVPVYRPTVDEAGALTPAIVPPLKVRDFSFTSAIDAI